MILFERHPGDIFRVAVLVSVLVSSTSTSTVAWSLSPPSSSSPSPQPSSLSSSSLPDPNSLTHSTVPTTKSFFTDILRNANVSGPTSDIGRDSFLRKTTRGGLVIVSTLTSFYTPSPSHATAAGNGDAAASDAGGRGGGGQFRSSGPLDAGEAVRRGAANIPGYGPTDIFYPLQMKGSWIMTRQVELYPPPPISSSSSYSSSTTTSTTTTDSSNNQGGRRPVTTTFTLTYPYRFIQSIDDDAVVADRGYNQASFEKALLEFVTKQDKKVVDPDDNDNDNDDGTTDRVRYEWSVSNPNDVRVVLPDGTRKEIKVTKRSTERNAGNDQQDDGTVVQTVTSSEFQRITQDYPGGTVPTTISARRVVSKYKVVSQDKVEGIEVVYDMGGADPLSVQSGVKSQPTILSKSRILLVR